MIGDSSSKTVRNIIITAVVGVTIATATMNGMYGYKLGADKFEKRMFAFASVMIDVIKVLALSFVATAFVKGYKVKALVGSLLWVLCLFYSWNAAMGFSMNARAVANAEKMFQASTVKSGQENVNILKNKYDRLVTEFETMKSNKRYGNSAGCTVPEKKLSKEGLEFCNRYWAAHITLEDALKAWTEAQKANPMTAVIDSDPHLSFMAGKLGVSVPAMMMILAAVFATLLEGISGVGQYAYSNSRAVAKLVRNKDGSIRKKRGRKPGVKNKAGRPKLVVNN